MSIVTYFASLSIPHLRHSHPCSKLITAHARTWEHRARGKRRGVRGVPSILWSSHLWLSPGTRGGYGSHKWIYQHTLLTLTMFFVLPWHLFLDEEYFISFSRLVKVFSSCRYVVFSFACFQTVKYFKYRFKMMLSVLARESLSIVGCINGLVTWQHKQKNSRRFRMRIDRK